MKILIHFVAVLGVVILLFNLLGWFQSQKRLDLYKKLIEDPYRIEINYPGVQDFVDKFYDPSKASSELKSSKIEGIKSTWVTVGGNKPMAGNVHLWLEGNRQSQALATLDELNDWARETPLYDWLSFILILIGVSGSIIVDLVPTLKGSYKTIFKRPYRDPSL